MKACSYCKIEKPFSEFYETKKRDGSSKPSSRCKECSRVISHESYERRVRDIHPNVDIHRENRARLEEARKAGLKHYDSVKPCKHGHVGKRLVSTQQCCKCLRQRKREQRIASGGPKIDPGKLAQYKRLFASNLGKAHYFTGLTCSNGHIAKRLVSTRQCVDCLRGRESRIAVLTQQAINRINAKRRRRHMRVKQRKYQSEVLMSRSGYRAKRFMYETIRRMVNAGLEKRSTRSAEFLGYTPRQLIARIEHQFADGMDWSNYGEWHIDHTIPIAHFLSKGESRPHIINALCNLKPMWAWDNLSKGSRHKASA